MWVREGLQNQTRFFTDFRVCLEGLREVPARTGAQVSVLQLGPKKAPKSELKRTVLGPKIRTILTLGPPKRTRDSSGNHSRCHSFLPPTPHWPKMALEDPPGRIWRAIFGPARSNALIHAQKNQELHFSGFRTAGGQPACSLMPKQIQDLSFSGFLNRRRP